MFLPLSLSRLLLDSTVYMSNRSDKKQELLFLITPLEGPGGSMSQVVGLPNNTYKPVTNTAWVCARHCKLQKGCTLLAAASDQVYQLLAHVGGSLRLLWPLPPLKLVTMI